MSTPRPVAAAPALRFAVIGTGRIGQMHAELLASQVKGATLGAVSDSVASRAEEVGHALGAPALSTDQIMADAAIDAVAICAPTEAHVPLIIQAAEAGKAIFCEKPVSLELAEVDRALNVVERSGAKLMVGFNRRFDPSHAAVRDAVAHGRTGPPEILRITSRDPAPPPLSYVRTSGGIFLDMMVHDFDMARFVAGSDVVEVCAFGAVRVAPEFAEYGDVDTAVVTLRHDNECLTVIDNSRRAAYGYDQRVEVHGSMGLAASENPLANSAVLRDASGTVMAPLPYFFLERYTASYLRQWDAFVAAVSAGTAVPTTGADGRAALVIGLAANQSLLKNCPVRVADVDVNGNK